MKCFKNARCVWCTSGDKRNILASIVAGIFFFTGWWFVIDASVLYPRTIHPSAHLCGVLSTVSLLIVNSISDEQVRGEVFTGGCIGPRGARLCLFLAFLAGFASLIASCWILMSRINPVFYSGLALVLQNIFILAASFVFKYGRTEDFWAI